MWINDDASSSTLIEVLASHENKKHENIHWNYKEM